MITAENQTYSRIPKPPTMPRFYAQEVLDYARSQASAVAEQLLSQSRQRLYFQPAGIVETTERWRHGGSKYTTLLRTLMSYRTLRDDWDGYGGRAAIPEAVDDAIVFLDRLPTSLPLPKPMVAGSGIVGLYWERGHLYASIDFDGSGMFCYITDRAGNAQGEENVKVDEGSLPSGLTEMLQEIADAVG
jgi:hypothetical protein